MNFLQAHASKYLPHRLKTWSWLPRPFRTLAWYDDHIFNSRQRLICCNRSESNNAKIENKDGHTNVAFDDNDDIDRLSKINTRF